jgi:hypothetical protein
MVIMENEQISYIEKAYTKHQINIFFMVLESILRSGTSGKGVVNGKKFTITISDVEDVE